MSTSAKHYIGQRLSLKHDLCTVRYVGSITGLDGKWLGVEWDNPARGKHAGEHAGVKYFTCRSTHPSPASFVKPERKSDRSNTFIHALRHKYAPGSLSQDDDGATDFQRIWGVQPVRISGKEVEEVGFDKVKDQLADLHKLKIVLLDGMQIELSPSSLETSNSVKEICPNIVELDLSRNLLDRWQDVAGICGQLLALRDLRLNANRIRDLQGIEEVDPAAFRTAFGRVKLLSLDETLITCKELDGVLNYFGSLRHLSISSNHILLLDTAKLPHSLTSIALENNGFVSLEDLTVLRDLPNLRRLILKNNTIARVSRSDGASDLRFSQSLDDIDLSYNAIDSWTFINQLASVFPGMTSLRVAHNPLYQELTSQDGRILTADDGYFLTVARLAKVQVLNFSKIPARERTDAELYYLSQIAKELSFLSRAADEDAASLAAQHHPRYAELCAKYGEPTINRNSASELDPNALANRLITITFKLGASAVALQRKVNHNTASTTTTTTTQAKGEETTMLELPKSLSLYAVLGLVGPRFGLRPMALKLVWETGEWDLVAPSAAAGFQEWDSEEEEEDEEEEDHQDTEGGKGKWQEGRKRGLGFAGSLGMKRVPREVVMRGSTRSIGAVIDAKTAVVRVEERDPIL